MVLELFKAAGFTAGHVTVLLAPAMVGCLAYDEVTADFDQGITRGLHGLGLAGLATICSGVSFENFFMITSIRAKQGLSRTDMIKPHILSNPNLTRWIRLKSFVA